MTSSGAAATWSSSATTVPVVHDFACRESDTDPYVATPAVGPAAGSGAGPGAGPAAGPAPDPPRAPLAYPVEAALLQADRIALSLRGALERTALPLARAATALLASKAWCDLGFARLDDYARERLGRSGRWLRDLAALGDRVGNLPALATAITGEDGGRPLGRVAAMLVAKVASPSTLDDWIDRARSSSIRALRDAVRAARATATNDQPAAASVPPIEFPVESPHVAATPIPETAAAAATPDDDDDVADRLLVRMMIPSPIRAAFDEAVDLFRAVEGGEASVVSFVEALVAEAAARAGDATAASDAANAAARIDAARAPATIDADLRALCAGPAVAAIERALAASTDRWRHLPAHVESSWALSLAGVTLARFRALCHEAGRGGAGDLDRQLRAFVDIENELETRLGDLLADLGDRRAWPRLRFAGVGHYGEERLGLSRTAAEDRARLARDLRSHPRLREAYAAGRIGRESAALVARLLRDTAPDPACEAAWVDRATESTVKRMRDEARALGRYRELGATAAADAAPADDDAAPETAAPHARRVPGPLDDAAWHASLRREPGLARRRVRLFGHLALGSPDVFQATPREPDAYLRLRLPLDLGRAFLAAVDTERERLAGAADAIPWDVEPDPEPDADPDAEPGVDPDAGPSSAAPSWLAARMFSIRCRRVPAWVGLLALIEDFVDTWDDEDAMPRRTGDEIYVRDGWRCTAPGCTSRRNLEDHHLRYRSRGGDDDPANRVCACRFHHQRGEHGGLASCRGEAPIGVLWRLGRSATPAWYRNERRLAEEPRAPDALRGQ